MINRAQHKASLAETVYEKILDRLLRSELSPGDILNRRDVAAELGVSVAPVLEAFIQLDMEGFVESIPRKGTVIKSIKTEDVWGQLIVREALECEAARLYHGAPVRAAEQALDQLVRQLESTQAESPEHWRQEIDFHLALVDLAGCKALSREYVKIFRLGVFYRMNRVLVPSDRLERQDHGELLRSLMTEDPDEAERIIRSHLRSGKSRLFEEMSERSKPKGEPRP